MAETYKCKDGYARIFINQPDHWRRFVEWLGSPAELTDPQLETVAKRMPLRPLIDKLVEARSADYGTVEFFEEFQGNRLAAAPINAPSQFLNDKQTQHRAFVTEIDHGYLGRHRFPGNPYKFSSENIKRESPPIGPVPRHGSKSRAKPPARQPCHSPVCA